MELADHVSERGLSLTPRMVRTYRAMGLIAPAQRSFPGYAKGSVATNPPEAFDQAVAIAMTRGTRKISPTDLVFGLFLDGYDVPDQTLRAAYEAHLQSLIDELNRHLNQTFHPVDAAAQLAAQVTALPRRGKSRTTRFVQKKLKSSAQEEDLFTLTVGMALGIPVDTFDYARPGEADPVDALLTVSSVGQDPGSDYQDARDTTVTAVGDISFQSLLELSRHIPAEALQAAREFLYGPESPFAAIEPTDPRREALSHLPNGPADRAFTVLMVAQSILNLAEEPESFADNDT